MAASSFLRVKRIEAQENVWESLLTLLVCDPFKRSANGQLGRNEGRCVTVLTQ